jgi:DNA-binding LacI/PurR family transcriptional regulator
VSRINLGDGTHGQCDALAVGTIQSVSNASPTTESATSPRRRVTTAEIARRAGVSRATVSYVLNAAPAHPVAENTRRKVLDAAQDLGHLPYAPALALRGGTGRTVLLLTPSFAHGFVLGAYLDRMNHLLADEGFVVLSTLMTEGDGASEQILQLWTRISPDAVVVAGGLLPVDARERIRRSHVALVDDRDAVDLSLAGHLQARHLAERGVDAIVFAGAAETRLSFYSAQSFAGVERGCAEAGLPSPPMHLVGHDSDSLDTAIDSWLSEPGRRVGVCAHNDDIALRLIARLRMRGLRPGHDLLIVGSDDIPAAALELTTVHVDWARLARDLVRGVIREVSDGAEQTSPPVADYYSVVVRASA